MAPAWNWVWEGYLYWTIYQIGRSLTEIEPKLRNAKC